MSDERDDIGPAPAPLEQVEMGFSVPELTKVEALLVGLEDRLRRLREICETATARTKTEA